MGATRLAACLVALLVAVPGARAGPPAPLDLAGPYAFPGAVQGPPSAVSAGLGLADLWLGDEPFGNPAASPAREVVLAPLFLRVSRQDLRAANRNYDETAGFLDAAGARLSWPVGRLGLSLYAWQPVLRREESAYTRVPPEEPGTFTSASTAREVRAGLAVSVGRPALRLGLAAEWTRRDDSYDFTEKSGSPVAGVRHVDFTGDVFGFQAGVRCAPHARVVLGAAARYLPALDLEGAWRDEPLLGDKDSSVTARRGAAWEGGLSARVAVTAACRVLAAAGGRGAQEWGAFGVRGGPAARWSLGLEFHDERDPWSARLGIGQETQTGVPEPRAGLVSLGLGWKFEGVTLDGAVLRRSLQRTDKPISYDDRIVASATVPF